MNERADLIIVPGQLLSRREGERILGRACVDWLVWGKRDDANGRGNGRPQNWQANSKAYK